VDLGLAPYMVSSALIAVISMRLVRTLCPKCKDAYVPSADVRGWAGLSGSDARRLVLYRPSGCESCNGTGYRGRTGIYEILEMKESLRRLVTSGGTEAMIRAAAIEAGMV